MDEELRIPVTLPAGAVEVSAAYSRPDSPRAVIVVAHGAGTRYDHPGVVATARALHAAGLATLRFNFAYAEAGRRMPGPAAQAVQAWTAVMQTAELRAEGLPVIASGRSYGGRMASMAAAEGLIDPAALVYFGYPLHPPGRPEAERVAHLPSIAPPQLFLSGTRDPFVDPHDRLQAAVASCRAATLEWVEGAGHSFEIAGRRRTADEIGTDLADRTVAWLGGALRS